MMNGLITWAQMNTRARFASQNFDHDSDGYDDGYEVGVAPPSRCTEEKAFYHSRSRNKRVFSEVDMPLYTLHPADVRGEEAEMKALEERLSEEDRVWLEENQETLAEDVQEGDEPNKDYDFLNEYLVATYLREVIRDSFEEDEERCAMSFYLTNVNVYDAKGKLMHVGAVEALSEVYDDNNYFAEVIAAHSEHDYPSLDCGLQSGKVLDLEKKYILTERAVWDSRWNESHCSAKDRRLKSKASIRTSACDN
ncbi:hypothetical protein JW756_03575 [Candidatus Woesearchaeota archaeon]|nr:hypothetical protein [Candidatus Woesearchaeota archaeon]